MAPHLSDADSDRIGDTIETIAKAFRLNCDTDPADATGEALEEHKDALVGIAQLIHSFDERPKEVRRAFVS